jgi:hypothetical protein
MSGDDKEFRRTEMIGIQVKVRKSTETPIIIAQLF